MCVCVRTHVCACTYGSLGGDRDRGPSRGNDERLHTERKRATPHTRSKGLHTVAHLPSQQWPHCPHCTARTLGHSEAGHLPSADTGQAPPAGNAASAWTKAPCFSPAGLQGHTRATADHSLTHPPTHSLLHSCQPPNLITCRGQWVFGYTQLPGASIPAGETATEQTKRNCARSGHSKHTERDRQVSRCIRWVLYRTQGMAGEDRGPPR